MIMMVVVVITIGTTTTIIMNATVATTVVETTTTKTAAAIEGEITAEPATTAANVSLCALMMCRMNGSGTCSLPS